ncbi:MAG: T9SS type A sorting domain-containing protein [Bacteroidales bacterium]|jgi:hypothetical protein|nr:T9SS type A sorting domain-containing protein [Bacteroidales bacterium]
MKRIILSILAIGLSVGAFAQKQMVNVSDLNSKQDVQVANQLLKVQPVQKAGTIYYPSIFEDCADVESPIYYIFSDPQDTSYKYALTGSSPYFNGVAQSYLLNSSASITGVAVMMTITYPGDDESPDISLMDDNLTELNTTSYTTTDFSGGAYTLLGYDFAQPTIAQSFIIGVRFPEYTQTSTDVLIPSTENNCAEGDMYLYYPYDDEWTLASEFFNIAINAFIFPVLSSTAGLNNAEIDNLTYVYPNPAKEQIMLASSYKMNRVEIYNVLGQQVYSNNVNGISTSVNIADFAAGQYVVRMYTEGGVATKKIVVE